jgi:hypothetical protein
LANAVQISLSLESMIKKHPANVGFVVHIMVQKRFIKRLRGLLDDLSTRVARPIQVAFLGGILYSINVITTNESYWGTDLNQMEADHHG